MCRQSKNARNRKHAEQFNKGLGRKGPALTVPVHGKKNRVAKVVPSAVSIRLAKLRKEKQGHARKTYSI